MSNYYNFIKGDTCIPQSGELAGVLCFITDIQEYTYGIVYCVRELGGDRTDEIPQSEAGFP